MGRTDRVEKLKKESRGWRGTGQKKMVREEEGEVKERNERVIGKRGEKKTKEIGRGEKVKSDVEE